MWKISSLVSKITSTLFPSRCYLCKNPGTTLCSTCIQNFGRCVDTPHLYIQSVFSFKDRNVKHVIHSIKYYHRKDLIYPLTAALIDNVKNRKDNLFTSDDWLLVPIPMPRIRKYMRGYNQAELIAKEITAITHLPTRTDILKRKSSPKRQVGTRTRSERLANQRNSFITGRNVEGLSIILVDDVATTGATLDEARKTLLKAGAKKVLAITIAH